MRGCSLLEYTNHMKARDLLTKNRHCTEHFNRDEYPALIDKIEKELEAYFDGVALASGGADYEPLLLEGVSDIISEVEAKRDSQRFGFRKSSVFADDHLTLSLFIVPAAARLGTPIAMRFAELMSDGFSSHFTGTTFKIGNYDDIMEGFRWRIRLF